MEVPPWRQQTRRKATICSVAAVSLVLTTGKREFTVSTDTSFIPGCIAGTVEPRGCRGTFVKSARWGVDLPTKGKSWQTHHAGPRFSRRPLRPLPSRSAAEPTRTIPVTKPWSHGEKLTQTFQWILIGNILLSSSEVVSLIGPQVSFTLDVVFLTAFLSELFLRIRAETPRHYFGNKSNIVDYSFVTAYAVDLALLRWTSFGAAPSGSVVQIIKGLRLARGSLRLVKLMEHNHGHSKLLIRLTGLAFFVAISRELKVLDIQSVVGMLGIFAALLVLQSWTQPDFTSSVYEAVEPAKTFLVKWATLFFAPALVKLPLVQDEFGLGVLLKLSALLVLGFLGTFLSTAGIASLFPTAPRSVDGADSAASAPAVQAAPKAPVPVRDTRPYKKRLLCGYLALMIVSILSARLRLVPGLAQNGFMLGSSLLGFVGGMLSPSKVQAYVHPMFACILTTWLAAAAWGGIAGVGGGFLQAIDAYSNFPGAGGVLSFMLGPTVVALGVLLYERRRLLFRELAPMVATSVLTTLLSLFYTASLARLLQLPSSLASASLLRCISSPFAGDLTGLIGASPTFAIAMIVVTGFIGVVLGQALFNALGLKRPRTKGLAMGASAHGLGTVALAQTDPDAFPYSALSFVLVGTATTALFQVPQLRAVLLHLAVG